MPLLAQICEKLIVEKNIARRLFEEDDFDSETTSDFVIYISTDESEGMSEEWETDWSTNT